MTDRRSELRKNIPAGKTRVVGVDLFSSEEYVVGDYDKREEALKIAHRHNRKREGSMDDVYYVYDDKGDQIDYDPVVGQVGVSP